MTMRTIWKYTVGVDDHVKITMPRGAKVLTVSTAQVPDIVADLFHLWAEVDTEESSVERPFDIYGTGHPMPANPGRYVGTAFCGERFARLARLRRCHARHVDSSMTIEFDYDSADALTRAKAAVTGADQIAAKIEELVASGQISPEIGDVMVSTAKLALQTGTVHALISIAESLATLAERGLGKPPWRDPVAAPTCIATTRLIGGGATGCARPYNHTGRHEDANGVGWDA